MEKSLKIDNYYDDVLKDWVKLCIEIDMLPKLINISRMTIQSDTETETVVLPNDSVTVEFKPHYETNI